MATLDTAEAAVKWEIGCFNRPWTKWSHEETLKQIKAAGYKSTGLLSRTKDDSLHRRGSDHRVLRDAQEANPGERPEGEYGGAPLAAQHTHGRVRRRASQAGR
jgi:hypothetical protein